MNVAIITGYLGQDGKYLSKFLHRKNTRSKVTKSTY